MITEKSFAQIAALAEDSVVDRYYALVEEVGELALCLHVANGTKERELTEPATSECADIIVCALAVYAFLGGKPEDLQSIIDKKVNKWQHNKEKLEIRKRANEVSTHWDDNIRRMIEEVPV
jgi:hypothetical protein